MKHFIYADIAATTKLDKEALSAMVFDLTKVVTDKRRLYCNYRVKNPAAVHRLRSFS